MAPQKNQNGNTLLRYKKLSDMTARSLASKQDGVASMSSLHMCILPPEACKHRWRRAHAGPEVQCTAQVMKELDDLFSMRLLQTN